MRISSPANLNQHFHESLDVTLTGYDEQGNITKKAADVCKVAHLRAASNTAGRGLST